METFDRVVPVLACRRSGAYRVGSGGFDQGCVSLALRVVVGRRHDLGGWVLGEDMAQEFALLGGQFAAKGQHKRGGWVVLVVTHGINGTFRHDQARRVLVALHPCSASEQGFPSPGGKTCEASVLGFPPTKPLAVVVPENRVASPVRP